VLALFWRLLRHGAAATVDSRQRVRHRHDPGGASDQIIIDIGYTVLVIPRDQVLKLLHDNDVAPVHRRARAIPVMRSGLTNSAISDQASPDSGAGQGFYRTAAASVQEQASGSWSKFSARPSSRCEHRAASARASSSMPTAF